MIYYDLNINNFQVINSTKLSQKCLVIMEYWRGKVAVVTGASSGIGAHLVQRLAEEGLQVVGLARRKELVENIAKSLKNITGAIHAHKCDISKENDVLEAFQWIKQNVGPVQILINNAAFVSSETITEGSTNSWRQMLDTNIFGLALCTRETVKQVREHNLKGYLLHINSGLGHQVLAWDPPNFSLYPSCKFALTALNEVLTQEMNYYKTNIRTTSVSPGLVHNTNIFKTGNYENMKPEINETKPHLLPSDVGDAIMYALSTPDHVQVHEIILRPTTFKNIKKNE